MNVTPSVVAAAPLAQVLSKPSGVDAEGVTRTYRLYIPPTIAKAPSPLVLVIHGGGDGKGMERLTGFDAIAKQGGGRVCRDFDATTLIWEFFKGHPQP